MSAGKTGGSHVRKVRHNRRTFSSEQEVQQHAAGETSEDRDEKETAVRTPAVQSREDSEGNDDGRDHRVAAQS